MSEAAVKTDTAPRVDPERVSRICHALSDGTRLEILERLRGGERCVCDLMDLLGAGQSRLSFHLKTLKDAGLVRDRRAGRWVHYSLDAGTFDAIGSYLASFRGAGDGGNGPGCCPK